MNRSGPVAALLAITLLGACADKPGATNTAPREAPQTRSLAQPLPSPHGEPILRITGIPGATPEVRLDAAGLTSLSTYEADYYEPFLKRTVHFRGVPMRDLLTRAGVTTGKVHILALDDYTFDANVAHLLEDGVLLATTADGKPIDIASGGPIRIVFPPGATLTANTDAWVWSVRDIEVLGR